MTGSSLTIYIPVGLTSYMNESFTCATPWLVPSNTSVTLKAGEPVTPNSDNDNFIVLGTPSLSLFITAIA